MKFICGSNGFITSFAMQPRLQPSAQDLTCQPKILWEWLSSASQVLTTSARRVGLRRLSFYVLFDASCVPTRPERRTHFKKDLQRILCMSFASNE